MIENGVVAVLLAYADKILTVLQTYFFLLRYPFYDQSFINSIKYRMKSLASMTVASTRRDISDSGSHYNTGLGIKKKFPVYVPVTIPINTTLSS